MGPSGPRHPKALQAQVSLSASKVNGSGFQFLHMTKLKRGGRPWVSSEVDGELRQSSERIRKILVLEGMYRMLWRGRSARRYRDWLPRDITFIIGKMNSKWDGAVFHKPFEVVR